MFDILGTFVAIFMKFSDFTKKGFIHIICKFQ